jgi:hypothetical protein
MTKVRWHAIGKSTTLESNKSLLLLSACKALTAFSLCEA